MFTNSCMFPWPCWPVTRKNALANTCCGAPSRGGGISPPEIDSSAALLSVALRMEFETNPENAGPYRVPKGHEGIHHDWLFPAIIDDLSGRPDRNYMLYRFCECSIDSCRSGR